MFVRVMPSLGFLLATQVGFSQDSLERMVALQQVRIAKLEQEIGNLRTYGELVFNSVANPVGISATGVSNTRQFWKIPYSDRFGTKGSISFELTSNYYNGALYRRASSIYTDVIEDINGKVAVVMVARADGIDEETMKLANTQFIGGNSSAFDNQFNGGWSSFDKDFDLSENGNCALSFAYITQHYSKCWVYNLGSDADQSGGSHVDKDWGPHAYEGLLNSLGLATDGSRYSRVRRISRFVR